VYKRQVLHAVDVACDGHVALSQMPRPRRMQGKFG
jgi:hypothetical protein